MSEIEKMKWYIERSNVSISDTSPYQIDVREFGAIVDLASRDRGIFSAIGLAFQYGQAKGWRAAKAKAGK